MIQHSQCHSTSANPSQGRGMRLLRKVSQFEIGVSRSPASIDGSPTKRGSLIRYGYRSTSGQVLSARSPLIVQVGNNTCSGSSGVLKFSNFFQAIFMYSFHKRAGILPPVTFNMGRLSSYPIQIPVTSPGTKPTNQASLYSEVVPVFPPISLGDPDQFAFRPVP